LKEIEVEKVQFILVENLLSELKREFGEKDNELAKVTKLKKVKLRRENNEGICSEFHKDSKKKCIWEKSASRRIQERDEWSGKEKVNGGKKVIYKYITVV